VPRNEKHNAKAGAGVNCKLNKIFQKFRKEKEIG